MWRQVFSVYTIIVHYHYVFVISGLTLWPFSYQHLFTHFSYTSYNSYCSSLSVLGSSSKPLWSAELLSK
ncbi:Protein of unknown function [Cotesia congregata]|uniref:Uncharacterized protein n=1 Tax=Cotesia congregata TaxID=51543 RepID=A0A8J2HL27_COTCN|nr:Protein of unknown function [Cotesia congregata]